jgi:hypothetical protein
VQRYVTNPQVIHETIEGETIIIDLATGTYFSLQGAAPEIWNGIAAGASDEQIVARLEALYAADAAELAPAVATVLHELVSDQLVAPSENGEGAVAASDPGAASDPVAAAERGPFVAPRLERYTDMQDIILLDPVHKVDGRGWPHPADTAAG